MIRKMNKNIINNKYSIKENKLQKYNVKYYIKIID